MTLDEKLRQVAEVLRNALIISAPKDTWNLALNAIRIVQEHGDLYIVIGGEIAPYAVYTNEPWINRSGTNPNEGWIQKTIEDNKHLIKSILSGAYTHDEIDQLRKKQQAVIDHQFVRRWIGGD